MDDPMDDPLDKPKGVSFQRPTEDVMIADLKRSGKRRTMYEKMTNALRSTKYELVIEAGCYTYVPVVADEEENGMGKKWPKRCRWWRQLKLKYLKGEWCPDPFLFCLELSVFLSSQFLNFSNSLMQQ